MLQVKGFVAGPSWGTRVRSVGLRQAWWRPGPAGGDLPVGWLVMARVGLKRHGRVTRVLEFSVLIGCY